jgi:UPF0755 protein
MKRKIIYSIVLIILIGGGYVAWQVFGPTVNAPEGKYFYIKTGSTYQDVKNSLIEQNIIGGTFFFDKLASQAKYPNAVKAGRYEIKKGTSLYNLVRMLRAGNQAPVKLVINKLRTKEDLAQKLAANFEADSSSFSSFLNNTDSLQKYDLDSNTVMTAVIPNTYSILWNTSPGRIFKKLYTEQEKFWNTERTQKAAALNMTPQQVYTMASIVEEETNAEEDKGNIASVYINRIETGMKLEADPTVKFAMRDFGLKRIMNVHLSYPSPYNTYLHTGLPPGPICTPSSKTIDAVLNAPQTNYIFFVAKPDFKGLSNFAATYAEHQVFANAYRHAVDSLLKAKAMK